MYSDRKKLLKLAILALFGDFSAENLNKTEVGTKSFAKNAFLKKITKLTFVSNFTVNIYFPATMSWPNTKLVKAFSDVLAFLRHGLSVN